MTHSMGSDHPAANLKPFTSPVGYKYIGTKRCQHDNYFLRLGPFFVEDESGTSTAKLQPAE